MTLEMEIYVQLGVARPEVVRIRREKMERGRHWDYTKPPRKVFFTDLGLEVLQRELGAPNAIPAAPEPPAPESHYWFPESEIPKIPANGLILTKGRPGWWTAEEALVRQTAFVNRKAILVRHCGSDKICRVREASRFVVGQVIPVRPYGNIVVSARQPRFQGKW